MKRFKGTVKNNVIVLEEGTDLPDGTEVEGRVRADRRNRQEAFRRVRRNPITRFIEIDEVIDRDKRTQFNQFAIQLPTGYDERLQCETHLKGYLDGVVVQLKDGTRYRLCFYDAVRLQQTLEDDVREGRPYLTEPGLVVVPTVTTEAIQRAVLGLWHDGFFHRLKPLPEEDESRSF